MGWRGFTNIAFWVVTLKTEVKENIIAEYVLTEGFTVANKLDKENEKSNASIKINIQNGSTGKR